MKNSEESRGGLFRGIEHTLGKAVIATALFVGGEQVANAQNPIIPTRAVTTLVREERLAPPKREEVKEIEVFSILSPQETLEHILGKKMTIEPGKSIVLSNGAFLIWPSLEDGFNQQFISLLSALLHDQGGAVDVRLEAYANAAIIQTVARKGWNPEVSFTFTSPPNETFNGRLSDFILLTRGALMGAKMPGGKASFGRLEEIANVWTVLLRTKPRQL